MKINNSTQWLPVVGFTFCLGSLSGQSPIAPQRANESHRLFATLNANDIHSEPAVMMLMFNLMNDSDGPLDSSLKTWKLIIDDKEIKDSGWIFANGPGPIGGYGTVPSGTTFHFGKGLPLAQYFPEAKDYKVYWVNESFRSNTITVRGSKASR
jgi:hypothetical protein